MNKSGGPDKRFKDNRELAVCAYDEVHFFSSTGLNERVQASKCGVGQPLAEALRGLSGGANSGDRARAI